MTAEKPRLMGGLYTEFKMVKGMVTIYCQAHHQPNTPLCPACDELLQYARMRLDRCPYGESKPTCNQCPIHCYKAEQKQQMKRIMCYSGPRMLLKHPILAMRHLLHERKAPVTAKPAKNQSNRHQRLKK